MGRYAILFALAGLAVGLWLGFNPAAHRQAVRWWQSTMSERTSASASPDSILNMRQVNRRVNRWLRARDATQPVEPQANNSPRLLTWDQIVAAFRQFGVALYQIWLQLLSNAHLARG